MQNTASSTPRTLTMFRMLASLRKDGDPCAFGKTAFFFSDIADEVVGADAAMTAIDVLTEQDGPFCKKGETPPLLFVVGRGGETC